MDDGELERRLYAERGVKRSGKAALC
jgi:hypothetical protein